jgi:DEAD/DEAH box helicase domain-containing protein
MQVMNGVHETIRSLEDDAAFMSCVTRWERMEPRPGIYEPLPDDIDPRIRAALERRGVGSLVFASGRVVPRRAFRP